ncbi:hypothetical protein PG913_08395 [Tenacibaculum pacificus]|uniref:hypothetical protein n=1 Tax=Tenacibaculum pacificus TaxID=3018314 RepID=UPI0022F387FF|nr:hypothetical protein [Tenacibaculum pacificus]WBX72921.1 hypothetical protein PG913_08395 [Tenacibaculum pacificus]
MAVDLSTLSQADLKAELERRDKEALKEQKAKEIAREKRKKDFLESTVKRFESYHNELTQLKEYTITEANKIWNEMYEVQGKEAKEQKQISIKHGIYKITAERRDKFEFTDEAAVHIDAIQDIMKKRFETRNKGMYSFFESFLMKNNAGDYDPKLLTRAKKKATELGYDDLIEELDRLQNCLTVNGTALYCRAFKQLKTGGWKDVVIQFSSL